MFFFSCWTVEYAESLWPCVCVCEWVVSRIRIWLYNMQEILKRKGFLVSPNLGTLGKPVFYYKTLKMPFFPFLTATEEAVAYLYIYTHILKIFMCWIEVGAWSCTCRHFEGGNIGIFDFLFVGGGLEVAARRRFGGGQSCNKAEIQCSFFPPIRIRKHFWNCANSLASTFLLNGILNTSTSCLLWSYYLVQVRPFEGILSGPSLLFKAVCQKH